MHAQRPTRSPCTPQHAGHPRPSDRGHPNELCEGIRGQPSELCEGIRGQPSEELEFTMDTIIELDQKIRHHVRFTLNKLEIEMLISINQVQSAQHWIMVVHNGRRWSNVIDGGAFNSRILTYGVGNGWKYL
ncbi:hypothetical protein F3Y22_tig00113124pilonHSYRG00052 [Hibiscus syriacus]|uniref:Uncharacterized protein n=1 Tax=Hibiscus syriacus TaxID=106335 RepID=A0A6A2WPR5_HIBSY|nr:hypothetical protein F3Y22_tig00113124pilonHSYRG00052 [Hibiscus syriacus]